MSLTDAEPEDADNKDTLSYPCDQTGCDFSASLPMHLGLHKRNVHGIAGTSAKKPRKDRKPRSVRGATVNINTAPRPNRGQMDQAKMEARARSLLSTIAGLVQMLGEAEDAEDIRRGREALAAATAQLAEYEPWLKKILTGGQISDRVLAWVAFTMALLSVVLPIADRHGLVPASLKEQLSGLGLATASVGNSAGDPSAAEQPVAA